MNYCGIYKITQKSTGMNYIGQSINVIRRLEQHLNDETDDWHKIMQNNLQDWSIEIIEHCEEEQLNEREQYWINYYDSYNHGFNKNRGNGPNKSPKLKLQEIKEFPNSRHITFANEDMDRLFKALMTDSYYETLYKILFIHHVLDYDDFKYQFDYADNDIYIIKLMPFKNKQYKEENAIFICLDLGKKSIDNTSMKEILYNYTNEININHSEYFFLRRFYCIKNHGGYQCNYFWAADFNEHEGYYTYRKYPIFHN